MYIGDAPNITIIAPHDIRLRAGKEINIYPGTTISGSCSTAGVLLKIAPTNCDVVLINSPYGHVKQNEKIEFGIKLTNKQKDAIKNYFANTGVTQINPYNYKSDPNFPGHIDVMAHFVSHTGRTYDIPGFYYRDYKEDAANNVWNESTNDYPLRVRFSPNEIGAWSVSFDVKSSIPGDDRMGLRIDQNCSVPVGNGFYCDKNTSNLGILEVGKFKKNLRFRDLDLNGNPKSFFAIGENVAEPWPNNVLAPNYWDPVLRLDDYLYQQQGIEELAATGANTVRLFSSNFSWSPQSAFLNELPWTLTDPLCCPSTVPSYITNSGKILDYDARQPQMYELDKTLNMCHSLNLYAILDLFSFADYSYDGSFDDWGLSHISDWGNNAYNRNHQSIIPNIITQEDFFTDQKCKEYIKMQIRYVLARWGYESHILCFEIFNEVDNVETPYNDATLPDGSPNPNRLTYLTAIDSWQREMADYIKANDYNMHLVTTNYAVMPIPPEDDIFSHPNIDLLTFHSYGQRYEIDRTFRVQDLENYVTRFPDKPIINDEAGTVDPGRLEKYTNSPFHNMIWSSAFEGAFGCALNFWWNFTHHMDPPAHGESDLTALVEFMQDVNYE
jgi:hypothetical protein